MTIREFNLNEISALCRLMQNWDEGVKINEKLLAEEVMQFVQNYHGKIFVAINLESEIIGYVAFLFTIEPVLGKDVRFSGY